MKRLCGILLALAGLFLYAPCAAQNTRVRGTVTDAQTGEPIPYAVVLFPGTTTGITTDDEGFYSLESRDTSSYIRAEMVSYEPQIRPVHVGGYNQIDFRLTPSHLEIESVVITPGDNPAHPILEGIIRNKKYNDSKEYDRYICRTYTKFVVWTMGSLGDVTLGQLGLLLPAVVLGLVLAVAVIKPLNLLLLGENYARTMGLDIRRSRQLIFLSTTLLAGTVTAFCGPIGFIGLAVPHVARILFADADHRILVPASILTGIVVMLLCDVLAKLLTFPINTITALLGIPIVIWVVIRNKSIV